MAGRVTIRKAGEVVSTGALRAAGSQTPLMTPRAVSKEEAPFIAPARESTKTTMMPWKGWFQRWIGDTFGEDKLKQFRQTPFQFIVIVIMIITVSRTAFLLVVGMQQLVLEPLSRLRHGQGPTTRIGNLGQGEQRIEW